MANRHHPTVPPQASRFWAEHQRYRDDYFGVMAFEQYGGGQDEATGASGQASVVGYIDSGTGHWRFVCQHQTVNIPSGEVHLERVQCLICSNAPTACTCP